MKRLLLFLLLLLLNTVAYTQAKVDSLLSEAKTYFAEKDFQKAAEACELAAAHTLNIIRKRESLFFASVAYVHLNDPENAFRCINIMIDDYGFNDRTTLESSYDLEPLHQDPRWKKALNNINSTYVENPEDVKIVTRDIDNFWDAYDSVQRNPENAADIYKSLYFDRASIGLQSYFVSKIRSVDNFVKVQQGRKDYYASIRANTLQAETMQPQFKQSFERLEELYPNANFPPVYFLIGRLNSAGTVSSEGLLLAMDQAAMGPNVITTELSPWEKVVIGNIEKLPHIVAHELIHFQQLKSIASTEKDTSLLRGAVIEGMADFIGQKISGKIASQHLHDYAQGKENEIWKAFKKDMYLNKANEWIANGNNTPEGVPSDLGYLVGYWICQAYYAQSSNKKQAIAEMLEIEDFNEFYEQSKIEQTLDFLSEGHPKSN